jgi:hypothetical protein
MHLMEPGKIFSADSKTVTEPVPRSCILIQFGLQYMLITGWEFFRDMTTIVERLQDERAAGHRDRLTQWRMSSAFEHGLRRLIWAGTHEGLKEAAEIVQTTFGKSQSLSNDPLVFPSSTEILTTVGMGAAFIHTVPIGEEYALRLTLQCCVDAASLVEILLRDGQRIDNTNYICNTVKYYENHGSPCQDSQQRGQLIANCFPEIITSRDNYAPFILLGDEKRGSYRIGTHTRMFQKELSQVDKFSPPYYSLQTTLHSSGQESNPNAEQVRETLEDGPLFHADIVLAGGKELSSCVKRPQELL